MGGGSPSGGGTQTTYQEPVMSEGMKNLLHSSGEYGKKLQWDFPLWGTMGYAEQMPNPAYAQWQQQYGQYNMPGGGKYYTQGGAGVDPMTRQMVEALGTDQPVYTVGPGGQLIPYSDQQEGSYINIPAAPPQYIGKPGTEYQKTPNFLAANPQGIASLSPLEQFGMLMTPGLWQQPEAEGLAMQYAQDAPGLLSQGNIPSNVPYYQGNAFQESPYYQTGWNAFEQGIAPMIENQMALSGLGRSSSLADALSLGWSQQLPQLLSQYATQYVEPQLGREMQGLQSQAGLMAQLVPSLAGLGSQETQRELQTINAAMQTGGVERGVRQAAEDAEYADFLRRQALAEQALFGPMGMLPSAIGSRSVSTTSTSGGGGGGLFK